MSTTMANRDNPLKVTASGDREIVITRAFDAPRTLVYDALTKPELLKRWLGVFGGWTLDVCEVDLQVGGRYRYLWRGPDGAELGMRGVYREIVPFERIVSTEKFDESWYPGDAVGTAILVERGGKTTLTTTVVYVSKEARDGVLKSPMESGMARGYDALDTLLAPMVARKGETVSTSLAGEMNPMQTITPFLWFDGQAEEAMNFYVSIFKNSKVGRVSRYGEGGPAPKGTVISATFQLDGQDFHALNGGPMYSFTPAISFFVNVETQQEVDELWDKLSAGGEKSRCGWLKDKFGLSWQIIPSTLGRLLQDKDPAKSQRVMQAMLQMDKIDIKKLQQAYDQG